MYALLRVFGCTFEYALQLTVNCNFVRKLKQNKTINVTAKITAVEMCLVGNTLCLNKKQDTKLLPITSPNVNRFSKFFHWQTHW